MEVPDIGKLTDSRTRFLVLLYGTLEYDGRAQRMVEILRNLGSVTVLDVVAEEPAESEWPVETCRIRVRLPKSGGKIAKHLLFWCAALQVALQVRPSLVVAENYFVLFPGWLCSKLCGAKLVYDAYELIIPERGRAMSKRDVLWYWLERWTVHRAHLVIAANENRARLMSEHYKLKEVPTVVRNIPPCNDVGPKGGNVVWKRFPALARRTPDEVLILYQGDIDLARGISRFVEAMRYLPQQFRLVVVGDGPDLGRLKEQAQAITLEQHGRFTALGRVPHRLLHAIARLADVGIVTYPFQGLNNIYCAPNKIYEYAQAGLPVVATDQPPLRHMVNAYGIGTLVGELDTPEEVAQAILRVALLGKVAYRQALQRFMKENRWEDDAEHVKELLRSVLGENVRT